MQGQFKRHDIPVESDFAATQLAKEATQDFGHGGIRMFRGDRDIDLIAFHLPSFINASSVRVVIGHIKPSPNFRTLANGIAHPKP
jgi:hypothetical protein